MTREALLLARIRTWAAEGRIADVPRWLTLHRLETVLPDLRAAADPSALARRGLAGNLVILQKAERLFAALRAEAVPVLTLKGIDVIDRLYRGREADRTTGDIDILVPEPEFARTLAIVDRLDYHHDAQESREAQERWSKDVVFRDSDGLPLDVHRELMIDLGFTRTWSDLEAADALEPGAGYAGTTRLTLEALTVYLLVHMAAHKFGAESLRWVMDIAVLLDRHAEDLDGERLVRLAERLRGRRAAGATVAALERLLPNADLGPLAALPLRDLRERGALRLVDLERVLVMGPAGTSKRRSVLSRMLLEPGVTDAASFVYRKFRIGGSRRTGRESGTSTGKP